MPFRFSPSTLSLMNDCERCFWLKHKAGIPRPRGIFPGLPGAIDKIIQAETAGFAGKSKPKWLLSDSEGVINAGPKKMRMTTNDFVLTGIVDDLIKDDKGYTIIDYKTARAPYTQAMAQRYYALQMDCYAYLCEGNGYTPVKKVYLVFFTPEKTLFLEDDRILQPSAHWDIRFEVTPLELPVNPQNAKDVLKKALDVCNLDEPPVASETCEYCRWIEKIKEEKL